jgi:hypothetical protein
MVVEQVSGLRVGDHVEWMSAAEDDFPTAGTIVAIRPRGGAAEDVSDYVVQVTPTVFGIYQRAQLINLGHEPLEELLEMEMLVP